MIYYADGSSSETGSQIAVTDIEGNLLISAFVESNLTSNELEYYALLYAVNKAEEGSIIFSDSEVCVKQLNSDYNIRNKLFKPFVKKIRKKIKEKKLTIKWIPRDANLAGHILEKNVARKTRERRIIRKLNENKINGTE